MPNVNRDAGQRRLTRNTAFSIQDNNKDAGRSNRPEWDKESGVGKLEKQLGKRNPFDSPEQAVVVNLLRTNDLFQHRFGQLFREYGLNQPQYNILRILYGEGDKLPSLEIAKRMITVCPAITGLIDKLEKKRLVKRQRCTRDRRVSYVKLTRQGKKLIEKLHQPNLAMHEQLVGHLSKKELAQLEALLEKAREATSPNHV